MSNIFISLLLAALVSFTAPIILISGAIALLGIIGYVPGFWELTHRGTFYILEFLAVFGDGKPFQGIITLGLTLSIAGILLDILNFYRYQNFSDRDVI